MSSQSTTYYRIFKKYLVWVAIWKLFAVAPMLLPFDNSKPGSYIMEEIWKDVKDYEGYYRISNCGNVKSIKFTNRYGTFSRNFLLNLNITAYGYHAVMLCKNRNNKFIGVHRLVAIAFIPNPENKPCVNHRDFNRTNNNIENLEWVTHRENIVYSISHGRRDHLKLENSTNCKLSLNDVIHIRSLSGKLTKRKIAKMYNVCDSNIWRIIHNKTWKIN